MCVYIYNIISYSSTRVRFGVVDCGAEIIFFPPSCFFYFFPFLLQTQNHRHTRLVPTPGTRLPPHHRTRHSLSHPIRPSATPHTPGKERCRGLPALRNRRPSVGGAAPVVPGCGRRSPNGRERPAQPPVYRSVGHPASFVSRFFFPLCGARNPFRGRTTPFALFASRRTPAAVLAHPPYGTVVVVSVAIHDRRTSASNLFTSYRSRHATAPFLRT